MAEKIKYTRRDLKGPDEFISTFGRGIAWTKENRLRVAAGAAAAIALVVLALGARAYLDWQENKASRELWPLLARAREFVMAPAAADPERLATLEQSLLTYAGTHPKARATVYARYYLGSIGFLRGDYDAAIAQFRAGIALGKTGGIMEYLLREGIASSLEAKGDFSGAAAAYREAAGFAEANMKSQSLMGEARSLSLAGKKPEAVALYRRILAENPETKSRDLIEIQLAQME